MDKRENKEIADKLDSLDGLPEGYEPNINSKWALVEEALDKGKNKRPLFLWMSIAAAILLLIGIGGTWMYFNQSNKALVNTTVQSENKIGAQQNTSIAIAEKPKTISIKHRTPKHQAAHPVKEKDNIEVAQQPQTVPAEITPTPSLKLPDVAQSKPKVKKPRYVQVDFDDNPIVFRRPVYRNSFVKQLYSSLKSSAALTDNNSPGNYSLSLKLK